MYTDLVFEFVMLISDLRGMERMGWSFGVLDP